MNSIRHAVMEHIGRCGNYFYKANKTGSVLPPYLIKTGSGIPSGRTVCGHSGWSAFHWNVMSYAASRFLGDRKHRVYHTRIVLGGSSPIDNCFIGGRSPCRYIRRQAFHQLFHIIISHIVFTVLASQVIIIDLADIQFILRYCLFRHRSQLIQSRTIYNGNSNPTCPSHRGTNSGIQLLIRFIIRFSYLHTHIGSLEFNL